VLRLHVDNWHLHMHKSLVWFDRIDNPCSQNLFHRCTALENSLPSSEQCRRATRSIHVSMHTCFEQYLENNSTKWSIIGGQIEIDAWIHMLWWSLREQNCVYINGFSSYKTRPVIENNPVIATNREKLQMFKNNLNYSCYEIGLLWSLE
jgi:hypothetical protein